MENFPPSAPTFPARREGVSGRKGGGLGCARYRPVAACARRCVPVAVRLLHPASRGRALAGGFGGELFAGRLAAGGLAGRLLGAGHASAGVAALHLPEGGGGGRGAGRPPGSAPPVSAPHRHTRAHTERAAPSVPCPPRAPARATAGPAVSPRARGRLTPPTAEGGEKKKNYKLNVCRSRNIKK